MEAALEEKPLWFYSIKSSSPTPAPALQGLGCVCVCVWGGGTLNLPAI